jgi:hypothetical protein
VGITRLRGGFVLATMASDKTDFTDSTYAVRAVEDLVDKYRLVADNSRWCFLRNQQQAATPTRPRARTSATAPKRPCFSERYRSTGQRS